MSPYRRLVIHAARLLTALALAPFAFVTGALRRVHSPARPLGHEVARYAWRIGPYGPEEYREDLQGGA